MPAMGYSLAVLLLSVLATNAFAIPVLSDTRNDVDISARDAPPEISYSDNINSEIGLDSLERRQSKKAYDIVKTHANQAAQMGAMKVMDQVYKEYKKPPAQKFKKFSRPQAQPAKPAGPKFTPRPSISYGRFPVNGKLRDDLEKKLKLKGKSIPKPGP